MKEIIHTVLIVVLFGFRGYAQDNNTALALRRTIMVTGVELLQRTAPTKITKDDFQKILIEKEVSAEGMVFLNKAFEFYIKNVSTEDILNSYEGKESNQLVKYVSNGGKNVFGDLSDSPALSEKEFPKWLKDILKVLLEVTAIVINTCNALPWPC
ncbi:hypothetical protein [Flavobacterium sp.]|uniref:hypothetical protein n=1 Tax=Flavobacterium sp. TaxID=239 RepID=UPI003D6B478B